MQAKELLQALADPEVSPDVPERVRAQAALVLVHYPKLLELQLVHETLPELLGPAPPFSRLRGNPQTDAVLDASLPPGAATGKGD
ncbi:hypothetical protein GCM10028813_30090 [Ramlibacter alkalitolerans]|uniref:Uncharacterized protein n=1 Tax=Ramlibacter alkalitolerans TaxID=2039631 RepID=A0ABS1JWP5_9BURK|nr:BPSL0761 family protein [Ramlibacter alkalitolerans]MBL0428735.1 hypothetical protein [Ramlibacter alkalitolerans]